MLSLTNVELKKINGGEITTLPNFKNYAKLFKFIFKFIRSWF